MKWGGGGYAACNSRNFCFPKRLRAIPSLPLFSPPIPTPEDCWMFVGFIEWPNILRRLNPGRRACVDLQNSILFLVLFFRMENSAGAVDGPSAAGTTGGGYWGAGMSPAYAFPCVKGSSGTLFSTPPVGLSSPLAPLRGGPFLHHWSGAKHPLCGRCAPRARTGRCGGGLLRYALCRWLRNGLTFMPSGPELPSSGAKTALLPPPHSKPDAKENLVSPELWGPVIESYQCGLFPNRAHVPQSTLGVSPPSHP